MTHGAYRINKLNSFNIAYLFVIYFFHHQNEISEIEGLETLSGLRFLTLSHNRIQAVQNIHDSKLGFLDLSHNSIENLDIGKGCASVRFYTFSYFMR